MKRGRPPKSNAAALDRDARKRTVKRLADPEHRPVVAKRLAKAAREADEWAAAREVVIFRSRGLCEGNWPGVCPPGPHRGQHVHHVRLRSQGGGHDPENLLHLCVKVHRHAHDVARREAEERGIIARGSLARSWDDDAYRGG